MVFAQSENVQIVDPYGISGSNRQKLHEKYDYPDLKRFAAPGSCWAASK
jgi:hypothetical protein